MKVWFVAHGSYSDYTVDGVFSSLAKAQEYIDRRRASSTSFDPEDFDKPREVVVNACLAEQEYIRHTCGILLDTGEVVEKPYSHADFGVPESKTHIAASVPIYNGRGIARAKSHKSQKHALKLAIEARQAWLRALTHKEAGR